MADIFDLQRHLFKIYFDELCVYTNCEEQVGIMVKQVGILNCRTVGTRSNLDGGAGKDTFYSMLFPMFRMALNAVYAVT